jgi:UDP-N-acetylglucosamine diphosphorylase/glucosamine-1-phosphate N-acetyltransferase
VTALYLYDDARARSFEPFALTRPASELRAGAEVTRRRWERTLGARAAGFVGAAHLAEFTELDAPPAAAGVLPAGSVIANARCLPSLAPAGGVDGAQVWRCAGRVAAVRLAADTPLERLPGLLDGTAELEAYAAAGADAAALDGRWLDEVWSLVATLTEQLADDLPILARGLSLRPESEVLSVAHVIGPAAALHVEAGATIEPYTVFDVTAGPVLVRRGATVHAFTRVVGPCFIGEDSTVTADRIAACSIGERSRVHGEMSVTVVLGHANKSHDGFVGHSYLGRWVNLGAGTTTSNLKNTYGTVALWTPEGVRDTGLQFLGSLLGDHAKTGIGLRLTTGTVVGAGANVYGSVMPDKHVPPFAWGEGAALGAYRVDKFLDVAERAMARRAVPLTAGGRAQLAAAYRRARPS